LQEPEAQVAPEAWAGAQALPQDPQLVVEVSEASQPSATLPLQLPQPDAQLEMVQLPDEQPTPETCGNVVQLVPGQDVPQVVVELRLRSQPFGRLPSQSP
jgi:hypothetical protein